MRRFLALALIGFAAGAADWPTPIANWRLELVASAPQVRHPSVVCTAPDGRVFVAEDPMDISAPAEAALGRILCLHPDGTWSVFATNLHAVFGLQYLEGYLYALHNPKFTRFRDHGRTGGDRVDLIEQTNPKPWALDWNDHVPANFRLGMDGCFYVAIGDKGLYGCVGRDGSRVNLQGGGILRLRPDATQLEVFSTGVRNILDVALNAEDELFTYDNTDEHQWMGRLTHMVDGGFYGYPHDFIPRRPYTLWMMHDFGAGAACGALACNEDALPAEYHGNLFLADFGKRQVTRVRIERADATYRVVASEELFRDMPGDFRPVGIAFSADGRSLYICDWQHRDIKADAEVGRLWKLEWTGPSRATPKPDWYTPTALGRECSAATSELIEALSHPSREVRLTAQRALEARGRSQAAQARSATTQPLANLARDTHALPRARWHAMWALAGIDEPQAQQVAMQTARDLDPGVARQSIRLLGNAGNPEALPVLLELLRHTDTSVRFQAATALGRIGSPEAIPALRNILADADGFTRYAGHFALSRIGRQNPTNWRQIVEGFTSPERTIREGIGFALRDAWFPELVEALVEFSDPSRYPTESRAAAVRSLAALHHQPPPWCGEWWAYHPAKAPPPARNVPWPGTPRVMAALREALKDPAAVVRITAVDGLHEARDTNAAPQLRALLASDSDEVVRSAALRSLATFQDQTAAPLVAECIRRTNTPQKLLAECLASASAFDAPVVRDALMQRLERGDAGAESRRTIARALGQLRESRAVPMLTAMLNDSTDTALAAIEALGRIGGQDACAALRGVLKEGKADCRRAAVRAMGEMASEEVVEDLMRAWSIPETRSEALAVLTRLSDLRAFEAYMEGLSSADPAVRELCRKALQPIRQQALPHFEKHTASLSPTVMSELRQLFADDPAALASPLFAHGSAVPDVADYERQARTHPGDPVRGERIFFDEGGVACSRCHVVSGVGGAVGPDLSLAGDQFSRDQLIESILYPSRAVREGYQQVIIETRDGDLIAGALKADTADGVTLVDGAGTTRQVPRANILNRDTSALSLMPEGLHLGLTPEQFADLIAYLESRKGGAQNRGTSR